MTKKQSLLTLVNLFEHRLTSEASPLVSLAMTIPAGSKFGINEQDSGEIAAAYKHAILQGTKDESRISLARKADLRPSPISSTLTSDLLTIHSSFHLNYLPEMISTFKSLFSGRTDFGEFEVENEILERVKFDGKLAYEDVEIVLLEAANRVAFKTNNLYFPKGSPLISKESLDTFHNQTLTRASQTENPLSFLLSLNDSKLIDKKELVDMVTSSFDNVKTVETVKLQDGPKFNEGQELRIEVIGDQFVDFLLAFPVPAGGFAQSSPESALQIESLIKKSFPSAKSIVTSNTSLLTIHFRFNQDQSVKDIKDCLKKEIERLRSLPDLVKDDDLIRAQERAKFNLALSLDSRDSRLLLKSHQFALTGSLTPKTLDSDTAKFRATLKACLQDHRPVLISRGNYKKLPFYSELF